MYDAAGDDIEQRYRVVWLPPVGSPLWDFGRRWTGWCPEEGRRHPRLGQDGPRGEMRGDLRGSRVAPAEGLAATGLVAPIGPAFRLAPQASRWRLEHALDELAQGLETVPLPRIGIEIVNGRLVLAPQLASTGVGRVMSGTLSVLSRMTDAWVEAGPRRFLLPLSDPIGTAAARSLKTRIGPLLAEALSMRQSVSELSLLALGSRERPAKVVAPFPLPPRRSPAGNPSLAIFGPSIESPLFDGRAMGLDDREPPGVGGPAPAPLS